MGRLVIGKNDLLTWCNKNEEYGQLLKEEWIGLDENDNKIKMTEISYGSTKKVKWKCSKDSDHEWYASTHSRTTHKNKCPYCAGRKADNKNSLFAWCQKNGEFGQRLIEEWTGIDEKGNRIKMTEITYGSRRNMLWRCKNGHQWYAMINTRTCLKYKCPYCNARGTSYTEQLIYHTLNEIYTDCKNRHRAFGETELRAVEYDIALLKDNIFIEYSPWYTHWCKVERDAYKAKLCRDNSIRFIYISDDYIYDTESNKQILICDNREDMLSKLLSLLGHSLSEINMREIKDRAYHRAGYNFGRNGLYRVQTA